MNLEELKSQASLEQKLLIEKVENLVRSEYNREDMMEEIRQSYISRISKRIIDIIPTYKPDITYGDHFLFKEFCYQVGDILREEIKDDETRSL